MRARLFWSILTTEARKLMSYRVDFWLNSVVGLIAGILIPYFLWTAIFEATGETAIGSYTFEGMLLYYIIVVLLARVVQGPDLVLNLSNDIYEGALSRYLIYPTRYVAFKYAQHLGAMVPGLVQITVFGTLFALALPHPDELVISPSNALKCAVSAAVGNLLYFLIAYPIQAVAFWADNVWSLSVLLRFVSSIFGGLFLPLTLFPEWAQKLLLVSPFPYLFWVPVNTLIGKSSGLPDDWGLGGWGLGLVVALGWCAFFMLAGRLVWKRGELNYTGVGI